MAFIDAVAIVADVHIHGLDPATAFLREFQHGRRTTGQRSCMLSY